MIINTQNNKQSDVTDLLKNWALPKSEGIICKKDNPDRKQSKYKTQMLNKQPK
jgi:ATP-dependent RNA circularization protein (DNA/RNA ligase family)